MFTVSKEVDFAAAHFIRGHRGECRHLHGHTYRVKVSVEASELDDLGMVVDFADLKKALQEAVAPFDHRVINEVPPFDETNTTAELIARHVFESVSAGIADDRVRVARVEVAENPSSSAVYEPRGR